MKAPLAIYVAYHTNFTMGREVYSRIYKTLCRNSRAPLSDGLDIPVYFTNGADGQYDESRAEKIAIIVLADENMWRDSAEWFPRIKSWSINSATCNVIPVALCKDAFSLIPQKPALQCISLKSYSIIDNWDEFETRIYDCLIRYVIARRKTKLKFFISHSKRDIDKKGEVRALELRNYLQKETKLDSFFDVNDILDAIPFDERIYDSIHESAVFIILDSNTYSSREWCRKELIHAKEWDVPIIAVRMADGDTARVFPYIGNVPGTVYNGDWRKVVNLALRTALDYAYESVFLNTLAQEKTQVIPYQPEAASLRKLDPHRITKVLYPEPPLGDEELKLLMDMRAGVSFYTPMELLAEGINLQGKKVAISVAISSDLAEHGMGQEVIDDLMVEIPKHILKSNGRMVYGGDLRSLGYTELFRDLSYQYGLLEHKEGPESYFTNYISWPNTLKLSQAVKDEYQRARVDLVAVPAPDDVPESILYTDISTVPVENMRYWSHSLTQMRQAMEKTVCARILAGGRLYGFSGCMAGIVEEFKVALKAGHPCYVIGGFGGASRLLANVLRGKENPSAFDVEARKDGRYVDLQSIEPTDYDWMIGIRWENLKNGLSEEENEVLFTSTNVIEIVSLVLKGLKEKLK